MMKFESNAIGHLTSHEAFELTFRVMLNRSAYERGNGFLKLSCVTTCHDSTRFLREQSVLLYKNIAVPRVFITDNSHEPSFLSLSLTIPKMAFRAEEKLVESATDEASEVVADVESEMVDDKFAASATDEASDNKDDGVQQAADGVTDGETASVHIVHLIRPEGEEPEVFDIRTLASVIGSEAAAKEAVVYHYTHAASGFAARLTPKQVAHLSEKPEVLAVMPDKICQLFR